MLLNPYTSYGRKTQHLSGKSQQEAVDRLKGMLISAPILGMPTDECKFYLDCDASDVGLGAVLSQDQNGAEVVIAYASRTLCRPKSNYDVTECELLAIIFVLKTFLPVSTGSKLCHPDLSLRVAVVAANPRTHGSACTTVSVRGTIPVRRDTPPWCETWKRRWPVAKA